MDSPGVIVAGGEEDWVAIWVGERVLVGDFVQDEVVAVFLQIPNGFWHPEAQ